jgi:hypothetical protein
MQKKWMILVVLAGGLLLTGWLGWVAGKKPVRGDFAKVDLSKSFNTKLTDAFFASKGMRGNDLSDLPKGAQRFVEVPFQVEGVIQLWGKGMGEKLSGQFPKEVLNLRIGKRCTNVHLLHGAGFYDPDGTPVAKLVLHYVDLSQHEIDLKAGEHLRDWWGSPSQRMKDPGTLVAWSGQNPYVRKLGPVSKHSIRIYCTTIRNPNPGSELASIDYVSLSARSAPFLLGVTVEQ